MKKFILSAIAFVLLVMTGSIAANADDAIVPYGQFSNQAWQAKYYYALNGEEGPAADWYAADFDDSSWETLQGPVSFTEPYESYPPLSYIGSTWKAEKSSYWVRRHFTISELNHASYVFYVAHDDNCTAYLNGIQIYTNRNPIRQPGYNTAVITGDALNSLKKGENVLSVYVNDGGGMALMDFGLYGKDLSDIVIKSDVPVNFTNDATYPWEVDAEKAARTTNNKVSNSTSSMMMQYSSAHRTELMFDWYSYNYSQHQPLELYIDGVLTSSISNGSWTNVRFYVDPGDHVITFNDAVGDNNNASNRSGVRNIKIREIPPLETVILTEKSQPITFDNSDKYPWTVEDGYVQNGNWGYPKSTSRFSTTFTVDKTSKFCYEVAIPADTRSRNRIDVYVNGISWDYWTAQRDWTQDVIGLEPGTYTIEWVDTLTNYSDIYYAWIRNVELSNNWIDVELAYAGTLGYEVLYSGKANVLDDVEFLKVKGPLNADDWTNIKDMNNLIALDLSEAQINEIPDKAFENKSMLNSVILPEGITRIGDYAFKGSEIRRIVIPSTVKTIGRNAFNGTPIQYVTFAEGSQIETIGIHAFNGCASLQNVEFNNNNTLKTIGYAAFYMCSQLKEFIMPNTVTTTAPYLFDGCSQLKKVHFSDALVDIRDYACRNCTSLEEVHLPQNLVTIYHEAFVGTTNLRSIEFPAKLDAIQYNAFDGSGLESVKLPITMMRLGHNAFINNANLKYVELPSYLIDESIGVVYAYYDDGSAHYSNTNRYGYRTNFNNCSAIETVVMRAATPPAIIEDPFGGTLDKKNITLIVPSFAVVNYKLDTYWKQFGTIIEGDDVDYWMLTSSLMLTNNRRIQGKPDVDLYYGGQLTVGGSAPMPMGQFNMFVNETNPGRFVNTCEEMTADGATTKFAVDANKWYFFTPLYDVAIADIEISNDATYVFRYYDAQNRAVNGASGSWKNVDTDQLKGGQGYIFHCNKACVITFPADDDAKTKLFGTTDVTQTLDVIESTTPANRSWNYVGNPYPCYYDIYYMDFTAPITVWNGSSYMAYSIADDEFVLSPMQPFFVQKPDAVDKIVFHKEGRQLTTSIAAHATRAHSVGQISRFLFNLSISNGEQQDETRVVINNEASLDYEVSCDAAKFVSFEASVPQIYTIDNEGNSYAINERPMDNGSVQLAYYAGQEATYTIQAQRADGQVYLYDAEEDQTIDLTKESYTFQSGATNGFNTSRFVLTFIIDGGEATEIVSVEDEEEMIDNAIYDLQGRKVDVPQKGIFIQQGKKVVYQ
jgi:hypothetical protein